MLISCVIQIVVVYFFKAEEAGRTVVAVDPAYTSKTCCECGERIENLTLDVCWINCACGCSLDRDHNAAKNILKRAGHALKPPPPRSTPAAGCSGWLSEWGVGANVDGCIGHPLRGGKRSPRSRRYL